MRGKIKVGVFGVWRGGAYLGVLKNLEEVVVTAICDKNPERIENAKKNCPPNVKIFSDFDEFIDSGLDAVILCNYFNEHTPYAIKAMEKGIHVLSETTASSTLKECVDLCRAVEKTGCTYVLAENYPHMKGCTELKRIISTDTMGSITYAEGEYVHPMSVEESESYAPEKYHWRKYSPRTYYLTHSLAPLMYITETMPKKVIGKTVFNPEYALLRGRMSADTAGIMLCEMDNGALFRITGSCSFGPHGNWYRIGCINGGAETVRGSDDQVRVVYNSWSVPEGYEQSKTYTADWDVTENTALAEKAGHGGGDFWTTYNFFQCLLGKQTPFFNVYRAAAMSATAILGWYSVLDNSRQIDIPDFRDEEQRKSYEKDDRTPFPKEGKPATLPCSGREFNL
jgi:predicted dehydrogenase